MACGKYRAVGGRLHLNHIHNQKEQRCKQDQQKSRLMIQLFPSLPTPAQVATLPTIK